MEIGKYKLVYVEKISDRTLNPLFIDKNFKYFNRGVLFSHFIQYECKFYLKGKFGNTTLDNFSYESFSAIVDSLQLFDDNNRYKLYILLPVKLRYKDKLLLENKNFIWSTLWS